MADTKRIRTRAPKGIPAKIKNASEPVPEAFISTMVARGFSQHYVRDFYHSGLMLDAPKYIDAKTKYNNLCVMFPDHPDHKTEPRTYGSLNFIYNSGCETCARVAQAITKTTNCLDKKYNSTSGKLLLEANTAANALNLVKPEATMQNNAALKLQFRQWVETQLIAANIAYKFVTIDTLAIFIPAMTKYRPNKNIYCQQAIQIQLKPNSNPDDNICYQFHHLMKKDGTIFVPKYTNTPVCFAIYNEYQTNIIGIKFINSNLITDDVKYMPIAEFEHPDSFISSVQHLLSKVHVNDSVVLSDDCTIMSYENMALICSPSYQTRTNNIKKLADLLAPHYIVTQYNNGKAEFNCIIKRVDDGISIKLLIKDASYKDAKNGARGGFKCPLNMCIHTVTGYKYVKYHSQCDFIGAVIYCTEEEQALNLFSVKQLVDHYCMELLNGENTKAATMYLYPFSAAADNIDEISAADDIGAPNAYNVCRNIWTREAFCRYNNPNFAAWFNDKFNMLLEHNQLILQQQHLGVSDRPPRTIGLSRFQSGYNSALCDESDQAENISSAAENPPDDI